MVDGSQIGVSCGEALEKRRVKMTMLSTKTTAPALRMTKEKTRALSSLGTELVDVRRIRDTFLKFVLPLPPGNSRYVATCSNELFRLIESIVTLLMWNHSLMMMMLDKQSDEYKIGYDVNRCKVELPTLTAKGKEKRRELNLRSSIESIQLGETQLNSSASKRSEVSAVIDSTVLERK